MKFEESIAKLRDERYPTELYIKACDIRNGCPNCGWSKCS